MALVLGASTAPARIPLVATQPAGVSHTGDTNEFTCATFSIPSNHGLKAGSMIRIKQLWSCPNSANQKRFRTYIGSTAVSDVAQTAITGEQKEVWVCLRSLSSQVCFALNSSNGVGTTTSTNPVTASEDLSGAFTITITITNANSGETSTLEYANVIFEIP